MSKIQTMPAMTIPFVENRVAFADSYKYSQPSQYPKGVKSMYDYMEPRGGEYEKVVFFGLQYPMMRYFSTPIEQWEVDEARDMAEAHGEPFEYEGWCYIVQELGGWLPIRIKAVAEGTEMPTGLPLVSIESTDEKVFWIAGWIETFILKVWYPTTVATRTKDVIDTIRPYREKTGGIEGIGFAYHDFSDRGCTSVESAGIAGMARMAGGSMGTDNFNSLRYCKYFYGAEMAGFSIVASEHSTVTSWGRDKENDFYDNYLEKNKHRPIIACVMDSYNIFNAVNYITSGEFKRKVESDEYPVFVIRPDSGKPVEILNSIINIMEDNSVAFIINVHGYKVWKKFRIIWGDGINKKVIKEMLDYVTERGYSAGNIGFGSGGWGSQVLDRDTSKFAVKCSSITIRVDENGNHITEESEKDYDVERDVFKDPITDQGKSSKQGRITTYRRPDGSYFAGQIGQPIEKGVVDVLEIVWENGRFVRTFTFDEVRTNGIVKTA